ncbi:MAG: hypothetical protein OEW11_08480 [Nitrospirota bacterium]|nr:hypothetical protein [Nitrospirota bacterium]
MNTGLSWGGAAFMMVSWTVIISLISFCFGRMLGRGERPADRQ